MVTGVRFLYKKYALRWDMNHSALQIHKKLSVAEYRPWYWTQYFAVC